MKVAGFSLEQQRGKNESKQIILEKIHFHRKMTEHVPRVIHFNS